MRPLFAALDLPGIYLVHATQRAHQNIEGQVVAREQRPFLVLLLILAAAGLNAATAQSALATQIARPVAAARDRIAQGAVHKDFQAQAFGAVGGDGFDLVYGQLAGQDQPVHAQRQNLRQTGDGAAVGQGREVQLALESSLPRQGRQAQILYDECVRTHLPGQAMDEPTGLVQFRGLEQVVHGHMHPDALGVRQLGQGRKLGQGKILCLHARGKVLEAAIYGVGSGSDGGQKAVGVTGRGENFGIFLDFHEKASGPGAES